MGEDWRVNRSRSGVSVGPGYFSGLPEVTRNKLKETYAERLIAENVAKVAEQRARNTEISGNLVEESLRDSFTARRLAENKLAMEKAKRQLEVIRSVDVDVEARRYRTGVVSRTEKNMVDIEETHARLRSNGDMIDGFHGSVETVVSGGPFLTSGSISPNSSASMAEFRAVQKENLDLKKRDEAMVKLLRRAGIDADNLLLDEDKETFSDNTEGHEECEEMHPNEFGYHYVFRKGKTMIKPGPDPDAY